MNYTLNEYASDVVYRIKSVCDARDVPHPMIVSESGRAIAAHHSLLVFDILGASKLDQFQVSGRPEEDYPGGEDLPSRSATCSTAIDRSTSGGWSSATTTRCRPASRRSRCSTWDTSGWSSGAWPKRLYWATCTKIRDYCPEARSRAGGARESRGDAE